MKVSFDKKSLETLPQRTDTSQIRCQPSIRFLTYLRTSISVDCKNVPIFRESRLSPDLAEIQEDKSITKALLALEIYTI
jgi:hypothetical protein